MNIMISHPFTPLVDPATGIIPSDIEEEFTTLYHALCSRGHEVYCSFIIEDFGRKPRKPAILAQEDSDAVKKSEVMVVFPSLSYEGKVYQSAGACMELGMAAGFGNKRIILCLDQRLGKGADDEILAYVPAMKERNTVEEVRYESSSQALNKLESMLP